MSKIIIFGLTALFLGLIFFSLFQKENQLEVNNEFMEEETKEKISIITVYDNYKTDPNLKTGWGFSCLIKISGENILFDTGADSETLISNVEKMGIDLTEVDTIVLSHIHGDHTGGLEGVLKRNGNVKVYIPGSFPSSMQEMISLYGGESIDITEPFQITKGVYSTGELGDWIKEQSLIIDSEKGLIVITGCAHPGIVNIIQKTKQLFREKEVFLVLGGFHLSSFSNSQLQGIIQDFKDLGVQKAAPCHCSGDRCRQLFEQEYKENFIENGAGKVIKI